jgi:hypothetical protein
MSIAGMQPLAWTTFLTPIIRESLALRVAASSAAWGWLDPSAFPIPKAFGLEAATRTPTWDAKNSTVISIIPVFWYGFSLLAIRFYAIMKRTERG